MVTFAVTIAVNSVLAFSILKGFGIRNTTNGQLPFTRFEHNSHTIGRV